VHYVEQIMLGDRCLQWCRL